IGGTGNNAQLAISPDGRNIAFTAGDRSVFHIWLRPVDSAEARQIQGTEGAAFPFWSPDSRFIGFFSGNKLKKVAMTGGPVMVLADSTAASAPGSPTGGFGGSWSRDNVIVFGSARAGLFRVSGAGGVPTAVTTLADGEDAHRWPHFLPDGRHFFYSAVTGGGCPPPQAGAIKVGSLHPAPPARTLLAAHSSPLSPPPPPLFARHATTKAQTLHPH